jgi:hypothetical protein
MHIRELSLDTVTHANLRVKRICKVNEAEDHEMCLERADFYTKACMPGFHGHDIPYAFHAELEREDGEIIRLGLHRWRMCTAS